MDSSKNSKALESEQQVRELALSLMRVSGAIHDALRELSSAAKKEDNSLPYALLTEEYALRSRANTLLIEAKRLSRPDLAFLQQDMLGVLETLDSRIRNISSLTELAELITCASLFANSIMSKKANIIQFLLDEMAKTVSWSTNTI